jgi:hypothetical protein
VSSFVKEYAGQQAQKVPPTSPDMLEPMQVAGGPLGASLGSSGVGSGVLSDGPLCASGGTIFPYNHLDKALNQLLIGQ